MENKENIENISTAGRAQVLTDALPYIKAMNNKTVVIKYGGNAMINENLKQCVMNDMVLLSLVGINVVLVHGGGPEITEMLNKVGKESKFVNGLRYTDKETVDIVQMVLAGRVNKDLVRLLEKAGGKAVGLCGLDGSMIKAVKKQADNDLGFVGEITDIDVKPITDAIANGNIPVIATVACGQDDDEVYNINADTAAARIAAALGAEKLLLMTDVRGLLRDAKDEDTLVSVVNVSDVAGLKKEGIISGGMIPKIDCCVEAVRRGVKSTHIIDGRIPHSILIELLSVEGIGTMFI